jgi:transposase
MPQRLFDRERVWLLPPSLDELIPNDHPVRFVAGYIDTIEKKTWHELGIDLEGKVRGAPAYHPRALLSVWLYGFMSGTHTTRKLEEACRDQVSYLWLTGWQKPDHNTLWRFYKEHRNQMRHLFKNIVKTAVKMDLVDLTVQAIDGTRIAGNAAKDRSYDAKGLKQLLGKVDKVIEKLERENETDDEPSPVHLPEELQRATDLQRKIKEAVKELEADPGRIHINLTDNEANFMKTRQGLEPGYNMEAAASPLKEAVTEIKGNFLTATDTVKEPYDNNQLIPMLEQTEENTGHKAEMTLVDTGYESGGNLADCEKRDQKVVMPMSDEQVQKNSYHKSKFTYDAETDTYTCPQGKTLYYRGNRLVEKIEYRIYQNVKNICKSCIAFGICTKSNQRNICRGQYEDELRRHQEWMATEEAQKIYKRRKTIIEPVFGIIKEQMRARRFLLRGLVNVRAEGIMIATAFNLRIMCRIWQNRLSKGMKDWWNDAIESAEMPILSMCGQ